MFFNNSVVYPNQTIRLVNSNKTYPIVCSSIGSRPDVTLSLYDTNSLIQLSNNANSIILSTCDTNGVCNEILQVNFKFTDDRFNSMESLSCGTVSKVLSVPLTLSIARNTSVTYAFQNSQFLIGDVSSRYSIICNGTNGLGQEVVWISSYNKTTQINYVQNSSSISFINNGQTLNFASLTLLDEQYYSCGILKNNSFSVLNSFFLFVRGKLKKTRIKYFGEITPLPLTERF